MAKCLPLDNFKFAKRTDKPQRVAAPRSPYAARFISAAFIYSLSGLSTKILLDTALDALPLRGWRSRSPMWWDYHGRMAKIENDSPIRTFTAFDPRRRAKYACQLDTCTPRVPTKSAFEAWLQGQWHDDCLTRHGTSTLDMFCLSEGGPELCLMPIARGPDDRSPWRIRHDWTQSPSRTGKAGLNMNPLAYRQRAHSAVYDKYCVGECL